MLSSRSKQKHVFTYEGRWYTKERVDNLEGSDRGLFKSSIRTNDLSFTRFTGLPLELHICKWKLALPEPRIVYLEAQPLKT